MGTVITVNKINRLPENFNRLVVGQEVVDIEGREAVAETTLYDPTYVRTNMTPEEIVNRSMLVREDTGEIYDEDIEDESYDEEVLDFPDEEIIEEILIPGGEISDYQRYILKHSQKFNFVGIVNNQMFRQMLRIFDFEVYVNDTFAISYASHKGRLALAAFRRLNDTTNFKSQPYELDLLEALKKIIESDAGITIRAGWFSNLGMPNLDSVLLRGEDVDQAADWRRFKEINGASLSNIELFIEDTSFQNNKIAISLSKRGILYCKRNISAEKSMELTQRIFTIILEEDEEE